MRKAIISAVVAIAGLVLVEWVAAAGQADLGSTAWDSQMRAGGAPAEEDRVLIPARGDGCLPVDIVGLESDSPVDLDQAMSFTATVLGSTPIIYTWDYGDGTALRFDVGLHTVTHTYGVDGTYTVTLSVVNGCPSTDSASMLVVVNPPPPEPAWDKQVCINGVLTDAASITVVPSDTVEIVDRVWITATRAVSFTLVETWTASLGLVHWAGDTGSVTTIVTTTARTLAWNVVSDAPNTWHAITRTFGVLTGTWDTDILTGSLRVEDADLPPETWILHFTHLDPNHPSGHSVFLPLILRSYPAYHQLSDAPDTCPGLAVEVGGHLYREDFDHTNDNDWYRFTAQAGLTYDIRTFDLEAEADTVMTLYDTDCSTPLAQNDDVEPNDVASRIKWQAPTTGEYHVNVRHYNWIVYGTGTGYTLQVTR
jgi:PKD repeat protein